jgi:3-hydroxyisobutyrate dehydrogenase
MRIAFIGLGDIGRLMASHLAREPFELTVWNRTAGKAQEFGASYKARVAATPADAKAVLAYLKSVKQQH